MSFGLSVFFLSKTIIKKHRMILKQSIGNYFGLLI